jgi:hypothetical protein
MFKKPSHASVLLKDGTDICFLPIKPVQEKRISKLSFFFFHGRMGWSKNHLTFLSLTHFEIFEC